MPATLEGSNTGRAVRKISVKRNHTERDEAKSSKEKSVCDLKDRFCTLQTAKKKKKKWEEAEERLPKHATDLVLLL